MTTAKSLPEHGTYARANGSPGYRSPCYCEPCISEKRRARKRSKVNRQLGRSRMVPTTRARQYLAELHKTMGWADIAAAADVDERGLCLIDHGRRTRITRITEAKILSVKPIVPTLGQFIDATGTVRRCQALMRMGHSGRVIAEVAHSTQARIHRIAAGKQPTVRRTIAIRVDAAYDLLRQQPIEDNHFTKRVRNDAARKGWRDPQWWDDMGDLDDPAFDPDKADAELNFHERAALRREEIIHLAWHGDTAEQIFNRLNEEVSISTVRAVIHEWRTGQKRKRPEPKQVAA